MTETYGGGGDRTGRGPFRRIKDGRTTAVADLADRGMDARDPIDRQWGIVRGVGVEVIHFPELWH